MYTCDGVLRHATEPAILIIKLVNVVTADGQWFFPNEVLTNWELFVKINHFPQVNMKTSLVRLIEASSHNDQELPSCYQYPVHQGSFCQRKNAQKMLQQLSLIPSEERRYHVDRRLQAETRSKLQHFQHSFGRQVRKPVRKLAAHLPETIPFTQSTSTVFKYFIHPPYMPQDSLIYHQKHTSDTSPPSSCSHHADVHRHQHWPLP